MSVQTPQKIKKRDGRVVPFKLSKITTAIFKAGRATGEFGKREASRFSDLVVDEIINRGFNGELIAVEQVQDIVEEILMREGYFKTAKAYILYRELHRRVRDVEALIDVNKLIGGYLDQLDWRVRENANMTYSLQGLNIHVSTAVSSKYWLNQLYGPEAKKAHESGDLHIHDLYLLAPYCCGWELRDFLLRGFGGVPGKIESKPPKHFRVALLQLVNFLYTLQGEAAGAEAVSNFDTLLAPFIRYDGLDYQGVKQAMQEFLFNINVPTRVGFQTPFTNVTMDLKVPEYMRDEPVIVGGKPQKETYSEFQGEMDMFNKAFAEVMFEGDAKGRVFTFPIPTYNVTPELFENNGNLDAVWEMTAKYGIPYFANFINSEMNPEDARSMCPIAAREKVLFKSTRGRGLEYSEIKNVYNYSDKEDYEIYSDGKFVKGKFSKFENQKMMKVILENGHELKESVHHLNFVVEDKGSDIKVIKGKDLKSGMYLPYSLKRYSGKGGNKDFGFFVGAYAGDGSFDGETAVVFSLEGERKKSLVKELERIASDYFGAHCTTKTCKNTKLLTLKVHSRAAVGLCKDYVAGKKRGKYYRARLFDKSEEFRRGVIDGHYVTDGGNRHRIYTSSPKMVESLNMLAATLGTTTSIYKDEREGRLGSEPSYAVLVYQLNREKYGKYWFKAHGKLWVRIKSIEPIANSVAYCLEVKNGEPMFTVGTTGILTHNCRLRLDNRQLRKRGGGFFGANPLTGSIGVVTLNLPRIGYLSKNKEEFFERLENLMGTARQSLVAKRRVLEQFTERGLYPYSKVLLAKIKEGFGKYWHNHFSTIGVIGGNEACLNFLGKSITTPEGQKFMVEILDFMNERMRDFQAEDNQMYNLEATPAEGTCYRLAKIDKEKYPEIAVPYYTNSTQLPVGWTENVFEALDLQDGLQCKYTGGTVFHTFLGERLPSGEAVKNLVRKIAENYRLPYFTLTPTFSICMEHGYLTGEQSKCPKCGKECEVYSRVVGYLRPVNQWNKGKQAEFSDRRPFKDENRRIPADFID